MSKLFIRASIFLFIFQFQLTNQNLIEDLKGYSFALRKKNKNTVKSESWNKYRLGDVFKHSSNLKDKACTFWPDSLACAYTKQTNKSCQFKSILNLVKSKRGAPRIMRKDVMILHVRTGDALIHRKNNSGDCWNVEEDCLTTNSDWRFAHSNRYFKSVLTVENLNTFKSVVIVTNPLHYTRTSDQRDAYLTEDMRYLKHITDFLKEKNQNITVYYKLPSKPDDDFIFLSSALHLVAGGGGFSYMSAANVLLRGGKVYGTLNHRFCRKQLLEFI